MHITFLVSEDIEEKITKLGLSNIVRAVSLDTFITLKRGEISRMTHARTDSGGVVTGLVMGCIWGEVDSSLRGTLEDVARALTVPMSKLPAHFELQVGNEAELIAWIVGRLTDLTAASAYEASRTALQLGRMRMALERSEASLRAVESRMVLAGAAPLVFQIPADERFRQISTRPIEQWIGERGHFIHGLDLLFRLRPGLSDATIEVELHGAETGKSIASWRVSEAFLRDGWNRFDCPLRGDMLNEPIMLRLRSNVDHSRIEIGTGDTRLAPWQSESAPPHPIALRIWGTAPGVHAARSGVGHAPVGATPFRAKAQVPSSDLLTLAVPLDDAAAPMIQWKPELHSLMVHPKGRDPVVAVVRQLEARGLIGLRATVSLSHPEAAAAEFTLYACPSGTIPTFVRRISKRTSPSVLRRLPRRRTPIALPSEMEWLLLGPAQTGEVRYHSRVPLSGKIDIYFATRNLDAVNHYSWALFRSVTAQYVQESGDVEANAG